MKPDPQNHRSPSASLAMVQIYCVSSSLVACRHISHPTSCSSSNLETNGSRDPCDNQGTPHSSDSNPCSVLRSRDLASSTVRGFDVDFHPFLCTGDRSTFSVLVEIRDRSSRAWSPLSLVGEAQKSDFYNVDVQLRPRTDMSLLASSTFSGLLVWA